MADAGNSRPPDDDLLREASRQMARSLGAHTPSVDDLLRRTWASERLPRSPHLVRTVALAAAVVAAVVVPLTVSAATSHGPGRTAGRPPGTPSSSTSAPATTTPTTTAPPSTTAPPTAPPGTVTVSYDPFTASGAVDPSLAVTATHAGSCVGTGVAGTGSYRCFVRNGGVLDPCFAPAGATSGTLVCPSASDLSSVVELTVGSLPASSSTNRAVWAMQLANGQMCTKVDAAWGGLGPFQCLPTGGQLADCRAPVAGTQWWSAACQAALTDTSPFADQRVARVWS